MAVQRLTLQQIVDSVRRNIGEETAAISRITDANLYIVVNRYLQNLPVRLGQLAATEKMNPSDGPIWPTFWKTTNTSITTAVSDRNIYFPTDLGEIISLYDNTHKRMIYPTSTISRFQIEQLKLRPPGAPEKYELVGYTTNSGSWVQQAVLYPATVSGVTPSFELVYYRIPAEMTAVGHYPDLPVMFHDLAIVGPTMDLMRPMEPTYARYVDWEKSILTSILRTLRAA